MPALPPDSPVPDLLVVDDTPDNLRLLTTILKQGGFQVRPVTSGRLALVAAHLQRPDLVLLDVNMPAMNGVEVCQALKAEDSLRDVPVIFISALTATDDKVRALASGGVDYITKPFQAAEVIARVRTHLTICRLQAELRRHGETLEAQVRAQTAQLAEAHLRLQRLDQAKSDFIRLIAHELRTPLHGLLGVTDLILDLPPDEAAGLRGAYEESRTRLLRLLDDAILLAQFDAGHEAFRPVPVALSELYLRLPAALRAEAARRGLDLPAVLPGEAVVLGHPGLLERALGAILETLVRLAPQGAPLAFRHERGEPLAALHCEAAAGDLPEGVAELIFAPFAPSLPQFPGGDLGLAPPVAYRIAVLLGGRLEAAARSEGGFRLSLWLPPAGAG